MLLFARIIHGCISRNKLCHNIAQSLLGVQIPHLAPVTQMEEDRKKILSPAAYKFHTRSDHIQLYWPSPTSTATPFSGSGDSIFRGKYAILLLFQLPSCTGVKAWEFFLSYAGRKTFGIFTPELAVEVIRKNAARSSLPGRNPSSSPVRRENSWISIMGRFFLCHGTNFSERLPRSRWRLHRKVSRDDFSADLIEMR